MTESPIISVRECAKILGKTMLTTERFIHLLAQTYPDLLVPTPKRRLLVRRGEFYKAVGMAQESTQSRDLFAIGRDVTKLEKMLRRSNLRIQTLEDTIREMRGKR